MALRVGRDDGGRDSVQNRRSPGYSRAPDPASTPCYPALRVRFYTLSMRISTLNVNGIRSAGRKGMFEWAARQEPDVVCVQETKAQLEQLSEALYHPKGYHCYYYDALQKGYSGVAIYAKR